MAVHLTKQELENIKDYKYAAAEWTQLDYVFDPWWNFVTNRLSKVSGRVFSDFYFLLENCTKCDYVGWDGFPDHCILELDKI